MGNRKHKFLPISAAAMLSLQFLPVLPVQAENTEETIEQTDETTDVSSVTFLLKSDEEDAGTVIQDLNTASCLVDSILEIEIPRSSAYTIAINGSALDMILPAGRVMELPLDETGLWVIELTPAGSSSPAASLQIQVQNQNEWEDQILIIPGDWTYGETGKKVSGAKAKYGEAIYMYAREGEAFSSAIPGDAGVYQVYAWVPATDTYTELKTETETFSIARAKNSVVEQIHTENNLPVFVSEFGEPVYYYSDSENGEYSLNIPQEPGEFYVKAVVEETANYTGLTSDILKITLSTGQEEELGWVETEDGWKYYTSANSCLKNGIYSLASSTGDVREYRFDENGIMITGWSVNENGDVCYYSKESGAMIKDRWIHVDDAWYYMNDEGAMIKNCQKLIGNQIYLFAADGKMLTGWQDLSDGWHFFSEVSGAMLSDGWIRVEDYWYYLNKDGIMQTGWLSWNHDWYYLTSSGAMKTGWMKVDGYWYYADPMQGNLLTGWREIGNEYYYFLPKATDQPECSMVSDGTFKIDGKDYSFDKSGAWIPEKR